MNALPGGTLLRRGAYRLVEPMAFGGSSILYRAEEVGLNVTVAIKELYPRGLGQSRIRDFLGEGRLLARFEHPGIVKVYDTFEEHGTAYLVMEMLEGRTLRQCALQEGGRLPEAQVLAFAAQAGDILERLHQHGLLHGDLKPDNFLVVGDRLVLLDFGAASTYLTGIARTREFTRAYAAPEQVNGGREGPHTDVYGLSATLWDVLAGTPPTPPLSPETPVARLLARGLEADPARRPQSLRRLLGNLMTERPEAVIRPAASLRGHEHAVTELSFSPEGQVLASLSEEGTVWLWDMQDGRGKRLLFRPGLASIALGPGGLRLAGIDADGIVSLWDIQGREFARLREAGPPPGKAVAFSDEGDRLAAGFADGQLLVWGEPGRLLHSFPAHDRAISSVAFSADARLVATAAGTEAALWETDTGRLVAQLRGHERTIYDVAFARDQLLVATGSADRTVRLWHTQTGRPVRTLRGHSAIIYRVSFSPDSRLVASCSLDGTVRLFEAHQARQLASLQAGDGPLRAAAWSAGNLVAAAGRQGTVHIWTSSSRRA